MERVSAQQGTKSDPVWKAWGRLVEWGVIFVLFRLIAPYLPAIGHPVLMVTLSTVVFLLLSLAFILSAARSRLPGWHCLLLLVTGTLLVVVSLKVKWGIASEVGLIFAAMGLGLLVAHAIRYPNMLLPVAIAAGLVDVWGVNLGGPVQQTLKKAPQIVEKATVKIPTIGAARLQDRRKAPSYVGLVGVGDFLFLSILFSCLAKFGMNLMGSFWWTAALCVIAFLLLQVTSALPGLPFIALGIIVPNWRYFQFTREEKFALLYAGIFLVGLLAIGFFAMRSLAH
jgi:hypothetical protein